MAPSIAGTTCFGVAFEPRTWSTFFRFRVFQQQHRIHNASLPFSLLVTAQRSQRRAVIVFCFAEIAGRRLAKKCVEFRNCRGDEFRPIAERSP